MAMEKELDVTQLHVENTANKDATCPPDHIDDDPVYSVREQRKIIHRIDRRLISMIGIIHCICLMDRGNLGAASIAGMQKELKLVGTQYNVIAIMFFPTYIIFQPVATVVFRKIGVIPFLSSVTLLWGVVMMCAGFVSEWSQLAGIRLLIGMFEAGFFPGCVYLIATWYSRYDLQKRYAIFYLLGCVASAFTGILSFGFMQMNGLANYEGWRWIFIMEGLITCVIGIASYFVLVDFPDKMQDSSRRFLSQAEYDFVLRRIQKDRKDVVAEKFNVRKYLSAGLDFKLYLFGLIFYSATTAAYSYAYFLPIILNEGMGFSIGTSLCLYAPPYVLAGIFMYVTSWVGDRYHIRGPIIIFNALIALVGLPVMAFARGNGPRLFGVFLAVTGTNSNVPAAMAYQANNIRGQWKRAFASAVLVMLGGTGGITGSTVFRTQDAPHYYPGMITCMAVNVLAILIVIILSIYFRYCNRRADQGKMTIEGLEGFRYTL